MPNKKNISSVKELTDKLSRAKSIYFTDYLGLNVSDVTILRKKFFDSNVEYLVVKNTLLKIASDQNKISLGDELFLGSTAIAISYDEPVLAAKVLKDFLKDIDDSTKLLFADVNSQSVLKIDNIKKGEALSVLIGPEGDFSPAERESILKVPDVKSFTISKNILRSDTAVITAISLVNFVYFNS